MAVRINPCHGCPLGKDCEQRAEFRARVSGLGLRSATFRCQKLADALRPGRRITISAPVLSDCSNEYRDPDFRIEHLAVKASILHGNDAGRFVCVVDPGQVEDDREDPDDVPTVDQDKCRFRREMGAHRIICFLDEPDVPICKSGKILRHGECDRPPGEACHCEERERWERECGRSVSLAELLNSPTMQNAGGA